MNEHLVKKRIEFLAREMCFHKDRAFHYEMQDGLGEYKKAQPHKEMIRFFEQWIKELEKGNE